MTEMRLDEAVSRILSWAAAAAEAATQPGGLLDAIDGVVRGRRARNPLPQSLFIFADSARCDHTTSGLAEQWTLPLVVVAMVQDVEDPEAGEAEANRLAALARSVLLAAGRAGPWVRDCVSVEFQPADDRYSSELRYGAAALLHVTFRLREP